MMDKGKLRKADIFSGFLFFLAGIFIMAQALKMPMKDSWGGVQNVWYVSPAIFPLFVGAMIMLLGGLLVRTAVKEVGIKAVKEVAAYLFSSDFGQFLKLETNFRFYASTAILLSFVFLFIPRIDFFPAAILFLLVFISIFYLENIRLLIRLVSFYLIQATLLILFFITGMNSFFSSFAPYPADILTIAFIFVYAVYAYHLCKNDTAHKKKFKTSLIVATVAPLLIGIIFKYFLLVPMPFEGMVVELLDAIWYL